MIAAEMITIRRRQRGLYEWRLFPISRRVAGLTSAPCRSWRCKSRRAPSWAAWFWSTRLARSRSGKSYEVTGLCILNLRFRSKTRRHLDKTRCSSMALDTCVSPIESAASAVLIVIHRFRFRRFSVVRWECFVCFRGTRDGAGRICGWLWSESFAPDPERIKSTRLRTLWRVAERPGTNGRPPAISRSVLSAPSDRHVLARRCAASGDPYGHRS